jgi:hypothetical protein
MCRPSVPVRSCPVCVKKLVLKPPPPPPPPPQHVLLAGNDTRKTPHSISLPVLGSLSHSVCHQEACWEKGSVAEIVLPAAPQTNLLHTHSAPLSDPLVNENADVFLAVALQFVLGSWNQERAAESMAVLI